MIFKRRFSAIFLVLLFSTFVATEHSEDFKFDSDDLQVVYSDPAEITIKTPSRYSYTKEIAQCPSGESKMMLTLLLQSLRWKDVGEKKKEKAIKKMSRFFLVPVKYIKLDDIHTTEMLEMLKHSINKSNNLLNTKDAVGRIEFMIGCGDKLFASTKTLAHKINEYVKSGKLQELSGLPINWWNIWSKHVKSRVQRTRRDTLLEGSGNAEEQDYYDEEDEEFSETEGNEDEDEEINNEEESHKSFSEQVNHQNTNQDMSSTEKAIEEKKSDEESNYDDEYDDDEENFVEPSKKSSSIATTASSPTTIKEDRRTPLPLIPTSPDEDDDEDNEEEETDESVLLGLPSTTLPPPTTTTIPSTTTIQTTTVQITSTSTESAPTTSESVEVTSENSDYSEENQAPTVVKRIKKIQATSGKAFSYKLEEAIFDDDEGADSLRLELLDKNDQPLPSSSWIRFDAKKQEIYGLPLENDVSRHEFKLRATDSSGEYVDENVDVTVQQHKGYRSVNHEIFIQVTLDKQYDSDIDWKIRLIRGIVEALEDDSIGSIIVRDVKPHKYEPKHYTFSYTNDTLPKDHCPKEELEQLTQRLTKKALNDVMRREITVRNVEKELINACAEVKTPIPQPPLQPNNKQNYPPTVRNHVDRVGAVVGQLLVFKVPSDTFYDPEDLNDLKLSLLNENRSPLDPTNWLQFDAKNHEFYGVPTIHDKTQTYVLVAEDKNGLSTNDALVVEINNLHSKRDYGATFEYQLEIGIDQFQNAATKRKFIERIQQFFGDGDTSAIVIKSIKKVQYSGRTAVVVQNTTLSGRGCPVDEIKKLKDRLVRTDGSLHDDVREAIGTEFNVQKISIVPIGKCASGDTYHHPDETIPVERPEEHDGPLINEEVLITYVLPTAIILLMLLIALLIACLLYKRRNTGKMELGDEEERKSFRSKGIPVIFQDELDEKPEIVTKSPIILKDEKPPLLPQYNGLNQDGEEDVDQYIPPQPLLMGSRGGERGKSPVSQNTPSYRKPPPYVSP